MERASTARPYRVEPGRPGSAVSPTTQEHPSNARQPCPRPSDESAGGAQRRPQPQIANCEEQGSAAGRSRRLALQGGPVQLRGRRRWSGNSATVILYLPAELRPWGEEDACTEVCHPAPVLAADGARRQEPRGSGGAAAAGTNTRTSSHDGSTLTHCRGGVPGLGDGGLGGCGAQHVAVPWVDQAAGGRSCDVANRAGPGSAAVAGNYAADASGRTGDERGGGGGCGGSQLAELPLRSPPQPPQPSPPLQAAQAPTIGTGRNGVSSGGDGAGRDPGGSLGIAPQPRAPQEHGTVAGQGQRPQWRGRHTVTGTKRRRSPHRTELVKVEIDWDQVACGPADTRPEVFNQAALAADSNRRQDMRGDGGGAAGVNARSAGGVETEIAHPRVVDPGLCGGGGGLARCCTVHVTDPWVDQAAGGRSCDVADGVGPESAAVTANYAADASDRNGDERGGGDGGGSHLVGLCLRRSPPPPQPPPPHQLPPSQPPPRQTAQALTVGNGRSGGSGGGGGNAGGGGSVHVGDTDAAAGPQGEPRPGPPPQLALPGSAAGDSMAASDRGGGGEAVGHHPVRGMERPQAAQSTGVRQQQPASLHLQQPQHPRPQPLRQQQQQQQQPHLPPPPQPQLPQPPQQTQQLPPRPPPPQQQQPPPHLPQQWQGLGYGTGVLALTGAELAAAVAAGVSAGMASWQGSDRRAMEAAAAMAAAAAAAAAAVALTPPPWGRLRPGGDDGGR